MPAAALYGGDHWQSALSALDAARRYSSRAELWVLSAGYGLIAADEAIRPYSATFASGSPDSVWRGPCDGARAAFLQAWWNELANGVTLVDLVPRAGDGVLLVAAGATYLDAAVRDLGVVTELAPDRVSVIAAGSRNLSQALPVRSGARALVGGTDSAVNARVLAWLARNADRHRFEHEAMAASLVRAVSRLPEVPRPRGTSVADTEISSRIRLLQKQTPTLTRTRALRQLRSQGVACEQARFAELWRRNWRRAL